MTAPASSTTGSELQSPGFWRLLGYAALLGLVGVIAGVLFIGFTELGSKWYGGSGLGWFEGNAWWVAVAAGAGLLVGLLRRALKVPEEVPGLVEDIEAEHVDRKAVPAIVAVSAVSLIGGASLGPEVALGQIGGGSADLIAKQRGLDEDETKALTLSGMAGAFGGLFSSPLLASLLVLEVAHAARRRVERALFGSLVASSVAFGITFAIVGSLFLGVYEVPAYEFEDWHLLAAVGLGLIAAVVVVALSILGGIARALFARLPGPALAKPVVGGLVFGLIGFMLPLTNFTGSEELGTVLAEADDLGVVLLVATLLGKMAAMVVAIASGFIGGPIFPVLFIGGTAGVVVTDIFPVLPLGLTFSCLLAAVPGATVAAPFSMVLLAMLFTQVGTLQSAPILISVGTAYLAVSAIKVIQQRRRAPADAEAA